MNVYTDHAGPPGNLYPTSGGGAGGGDVVVINAPIEGDGDYPGVVNLHDTESVVEATVTEANP